MPIIIGLLVVIVLLLIGGPWVLGLFALLAAATGGVIMAALLVCGGLVAGFFLICTLGWAIWWCVDREAALQSYREAEQSHRYSAQRRLAEKWERKGRN